MSPACHLHFFLLFAFRFTYLVNAAFTLPTSYFENVVEQNDKKTWCYYPAVGATRDVSCTGDFAMVSLVHLNTTTSIGYYGPDNTRYGGAEWSVPQVNPGRVTLCVSGQAGDGTYQTACMFVTADNSLPISGGCWIAIAQKTVTDGCYVPGQLAASASLSATGTYDPGPSYTPSNYSRSQSIGGAHTLMNAFCAFVIVSIVIQVMHML